MNKIIIPIAGNLYTLASDVNSPMYEQDAGEQNDLSKYFGAYSILKVPMDWHRLKKGDILLYVGQGNNLGKNVVAGRVASVRMVRNHSFRNTEKIEYHFIWKEKFITIVLTPNDWGHVIKKIKYAKRKNDN